MLNPLSPSPPFPTGPTPLPSPPLLPTSLRQSLRHWARSHRGLLLLTLLLIALLAGLISYSTTPSPLSTGLLSDPVPTAQRPETPEASASTEELSRSRVVVVDGEMRVGRLVVSGEVLGYGCHGTMVYRGRLEDGRYVDTLLGLEER